ncbi:hypothetical protein B4U80_14984 [Leptotrombidium deliense]|uniref:Endonuclease/exonuclease/phosphatase domain-containing protein n=1 Tax=Leptotrombidium deliense TaxID=299467 RepID=A0A443RV38_9ACAR|nr:hypothetical protein B4U80_14984 [Leptotrombidium deliense]
MGSLTCKSRGYDIVDFTEAHVLQTPNDVPQHTFETNREGQLITSDIDLTLTNKHLTTLIHDWKVNTSLKRTGDHHPIQYNIRVSQAALEPRSNAKKAETA